MSFLQIDEWVRLLAHQAREQAFLLDTFKIQGSEKPKDGSTFRWSVQLSESNRLRLECHRVRVISDIDQVLPCDIHPGHEWVCKGTLWFTTDENGQIECEVVLRDEDQVRYRPVLNEISMVKTSMILGITSWVKPEVMKKYLGGAAGVPHLAQ